ncbi:MAG: A/G-specific adenine glycosylase [Candidatus Kapabacteria bacterium]|nr:A/G-specific adenine glycosylase [Candidatus Kapabacteria bacterium]
MDYSRSLLRWYRKNSRDFPWRTADTDPYVVLVSETMLQQTQTSRVAEALPRFLAVFPTIQDLARASNADVIRQWQGMGYNSRALRLRDAARSIVELHGGVVPCEMGLLRALPGVGPYTSAAIMCFAFNKRVVVLDVNVRRVYSRILARQKTTLDLELDETLIPFAEQLIPARNASAWHHAVMDLGATICTARAPKCGVCPLAEQCPSHDMLIPMTRPRRTEPTFRGEPQRIWRGRFIEVLRKIDGRSYTSISKLFTLAAGSPLQRSEHEWYQQTLQRLTSDGLIVGTSKGVRLAD